MSVKEINKFPGYGIDQNGQVWSRRKRKPIQDDKGVIIGQTTVLIDAWTPLSQKHTLQGYAYVSLCRDSKVFTRRPHRLVAEAFIPNPFSLPFVLHKNGVRLDNRAENLRWGTGRENAKDRMIHNKHLLSDWKVNKIKELILSGDITIRGAAEIHKIQTWRIEEMLK